MGGTPDTRRAGPKPFLITKDADGRTHLIVRETRYNGQGYPIVVTNEVEETFASASAARAHAKQFYGAQPGEFASK